MIRQLALAATLSMALPAAVSLPAESEAALAGAEGPAKTAMDAFKDGRHAKAVELAKPLVEKGNTDAMYLMGFAHETGQGAELSREKALEFYRKAAAAKHKDAAYRLAFILLASDDEKEREKARETLETAAIDDVAVAGRILGEAYLRGRLTPAPDPDKAVFWWKRAGDSGDIPSILLLANFYEGQFGFPELKNLAESINQYSKAAGLGHAGAMATLGSRLLNGEPSIRDEKKGREWLKKAADAKEYSAYLALGDFEENIKKDLKAALAEYERGKDVGQVECMIRAANFHLEGKGVEKDTTRGLAILKQAAEAGSPVAHFSLAARLLSDEKADLLAGYVHLVAAANGDLAEAQNELGLLYLSGKLGVADAPAGVSWLTRAAQGGNAAAQNNLATIYENGIPGVPRNIENAGQLYTLAANQGHGPATLALARLVANGVGTDADPVKAWAIASLAAERGQKEAEEMVSEIGQKLTDKQRVEALEQLAAMKSNTGEKPATSTAPPKPKPTPTPKRK